MCSSTTAKRNKSATKPTNKDKVYSRRVSPSPPPMERKKDKIATTAVHDKHCYSAPPPTESQILVFTVLFACVSTLPKVSKIDDVATVSTLSTPLFDDVISTRTLGWIRISIATIFFLATSYRMATRGYIMRQNYLKQSKLRTIPINLDGMRSNVMFTAWSWNLLTVSFALNGIIALLSDSASSDTIFHAIFHHRYALRAALIMFEVAAPTSMLVSVVVKYGKEVKTLSRH